MSALHAASRLIAIGLGPVILPQVTRMRATTPRLPDAERPWIGAIDGPDPVRLLVLGDSTATGVGVASQTEGLPGNLARAFNRAWGRGVLWRAVGANGATARDLVRGHLGPATGDDYDVIFLSVGANDALALRSRGAFRRDVRTILRRLRAGSPNAFILVANLPAFFRFRALPNPLRWSLYLHSQSLELAARALVRGEPGVTMSPAPPPYSPGFFASDEFHPSAQGYRDWVSFALDHAGLFPSERR